MKKLFKIIAVLLLAAALLWAGEAAVRSRLIRINELFVNAGDIIGVDLSEYQGEVDMDILTSQNISFVIIKATEGSGHVDSYFYDNWENARANGVIAGAYHFFSFDSSAVTQAEQYISTVGSLSGRMRPIVDVELYADKRTNPPDVEEVRRELGIFLDLIEAEYHIKPIIYASDEVFKNYLSGYFDEYPRWVTNMFYPAFVRDGNNWLIWQYSDSSDVGGFQGTAGKIDLNVLNRNADLTDLLSGY
ncbi:MAG: glycoside hydrolase family 25 [Erysipelotrichaceae bacterium]|nr:glycoside hydrolase family 25 [Erysipelotrichaceae bacterium]